MLAYTTTGVDHMTVATEFYDELFAETRAKQVMVARDGDFVAYGTEAGGASFALAVPVNAGKATSGNGQMVAVGAANPEQVVALHTKAIELGATEEGESGPLSDGLFHAGYFRDPFGNNVNFFHM